MLNCMLCYLEQKQAVAEVMPQKAADHLSALFAQCRLRVRHDSSALFVVRLVGLNKLNDLRHVFNLAINHCSHRALGIRIGLLEFFLRNFHI